jgi:hypothetical protein
VSYFLWIEDFEGDVKTTAANVFGSLDLGINQLPDDVHKLQLRKQLNLQGVYLELSFQDALNFIQNKEKLITLFLI